MQRKLDTPNSHIICNLKWTITLRRNQEYSEKKATEKKTVRHPSASPLPCTRIRPSTTRRALHAICLSVGDKVGLSWSALHRYHNTSSYYYHHNWTLRIPLFFFLAPYFHPEKRKLYRGTEKNLNKRWVWWRWRWCWSHPNLCLCRFRFRVYLREECKWIKKKNKKTRRRWDSSHRRLSVM